MLCNLSNSVGSGYWIGLSGGTTAELAAGHSASSGRHANTDSSAVSTALGPSVDNIARARPSNTLTFVMLVFAFAVIALRM